jgi:hypothetical protein
MAKAKTTICCIRWVNVLPKGTAKMKMSFDVTVPADCEQAEKQLDMLHDAGIPYQITGALFQGHGFALAAKACMEPDNIGSIYAH